MFIYYGMLRSKTDFDSRSSTPYGKRSSGYTAMRNQLKSRLAKRSSGDLLDRRRLKDKVIKSTR